MDVPPGMVVAAAAPVVLLGGLVLAARPLASSAWIGAALTAVLGGTVFGLPPGGLLVGALRGSWTGGWILLIVLPALLLFEVLDRSGALEVLAEGAGRLAPTPGRERLLLAWVLPSFLQGVAGFGTPIAMAAPMLVRRGVAPVAAVAMCLAGYQWSVTFGSMGSSYFVAVATARLGPGAASSLALRAGLILAVSAVVSGLLVLGRGERLPGDLPRALALGGLMGGTLVAAVTVQPALGSTAAGLVGLGAAWWVLPTPGAPRPRHRRLVVAALPYVALVGAVTLAHGAPGVRRLLQAVPGPAPTLPGTTTALGHSTPAGPLTPALEPLLHPGGYLLLAAVLGVVLFRRRGWWPHGTTRRALVGWLGRSTSVSASIVGLTVLAALTVEAGMVATLAEALAAGMGGLFTLVSPVVGMLGTVLTGSTTASNALLAPLQADVAGRLAVTVSTLLSGQTAGGNVGNAVTPVSVTVGLAAVGMAGAEGRVIRRNLGAVALLLAVVLAGVLVQVIVSG